MNSTESQQVKIASGSNLVLGIWLLVAPFIFAPEGTSAPLWNDIIVGLVVVVLAWARMAHPGRGAWMSWTNVLLGLWMIAAPFVFQYTGTALWNDVIVGLLIAGLGTWSALATRQQPA